MSVKTPPIEIIQSISATLNTITGGRNKNENLYECKISTHYTLFKKVAQKIFNQLPFPEQTLLLKYFYYSFGHKKENLQKLEPGATASTTLIKIIYLIYKTYNILLLSLCLIIYIYLYLFSSCGLFTPNE